MRVILLRLTALLLIAVGACAQAGLREVVTFSTISTPHTQFLVTVKTASGVENHLIEQPTVLSMTKYRNRNSSEIAKHLARDGFGDGPCYFIRSYVMKREDDTDVMHLDHVTTCTPMSRFQMKRTVRVLPAIQR